MANLVFANGSKVITVAASDKISVTSLSPFSVYKEVGYPNLPSQWVLLDSVDSAPYSYTSAAMSAATDVRVEAGASDCFYATGTAPNAAVPLVQQGAPTAMTTAATITVAGLMSGIITGTHTAGATQAYTTTTVTVYNNNNVQPYWQMCAGCTTATGFPNSAIINLTRPALNTRVAYSAQASFNFSTGLRTWSHMGQNTSAQVIDSIRWGTTAGAVSSGTISVYGVMQA